MTPIQERLFALQDLSYRAFQIKLIPTIDPSRMIGVCKPALRRWLASEHTYTCRFGVGVLMNYYLDEAFEPRFLGGSVRSARRSIM